MVNTGTVPCPAVRMSGSADTCYYATVENDGDSDYGVLHKCVAGVTSVIATAPGYFPANTNAAFLIYAYANTIGLAAGNSAISDTTTGWPGTGWSPASYGVGYEIQVEVTDTSISEATGLYVGVRAPAGTGTIHEWYGGSFGVLTGSASISGTTATLSGLRPSGRLITVTEN
jgi:hypothetical protein